MYMYICMYINTNIYMYNDVLHMCVYIYIYIYISV